MRILSIQLKNIKSHRDRTLEFSEGINVLSGPNGIGKSTIFEAIGYALFGVDAQSFVGNVERFVSIGAKKGEIRIEFQPGDDELFQVSRTVGIPAKWLLYKQIGGQFEVEDHKDSKETEMRLRELLGLNNGRSLAEQFELVIGPFQNDFLGPFVIKQPAKRRDRFDEILGIDTWRKTHKETLALEKAIKGKVDVLQAEIESRLEQVDMLPTKKAELLALQTQQQQADKNFSDQQQRLQQLETKVSDLDQQEQTLIQLRGDFDTLKERIRNGTEKIVTQQQRIKEAEAARQLLEQTAVGKAAFEQAENRLLELREQVKQQRLLEQDVAGLEKQLGAMQARYQAETKAVELAQSELEKDSRELVAQKATLLPAANAEKLAQKLPDLREQITTLRLQMGQLDGRRAGLDEGNEKLAEGVCPFFQDACLNLAEASAENIFSQRFEQLGQEEKDLAERIETKLREESESATAENRLKELRIQLQGVEQQLQRVQTRQRLNEQRLAGLSDLQREQQVLQEALTQKCQELSHFDKLQIEIDGVEEQKKKYQQTRDLHLANQQLAGELDARSAELKKFRSLLTQLQKELETKQANLQQLLDLYRPEQHQELRRQKDQVREAAAGLRQQLLNMQAGVVRLNDEIQKLSAIAAEVEQKKTKIKIYAEKELLVKFLRNKVFRNVSTYLSERFRKEISLRADRIYRTIAEVDEELCWGDNYQIVLRDMVDGEIRERADDQLSGGQTMSAVVALRLALLQTIGARIAFFDEPTSNLDATRRENLAHAFRAIDVGREEVTEHWYDQLFLISHDVAFTEVTDQIVALDS